MKSIPLKGIAAAITWWLFLSLPGCGDPGATGPGTGGHVTDSTTRPGPATGGKAHPYSESDNLLDPNQYEFFFDLERYRPQPFNAPFVKAHGIRKISFNHYSGDDNTIPENATEQQLEVSGHRSFVFDGEGRLIIWENERLLDGSPLLKTTVANERDASGRLNRQSVVLDASGSITNSAATFSYDASGRLLDRVDPEGVSMHYGYDDAKGHIYELHITPAGSTAVHVYGKPGDFPDATCLQLQNEILTLGSRFVRYDKARGLVRDVFFHEKDGRKTVRQVNMGENGRIDGMVNRSYNQFSNLEAERFNWEDPESMFRSEKVVRYLPSNDPERVVIKQLRNQGAATTEVWRFEFGPEGLLTRLSHSSRKDNGPEVIESVDFVKYEMAQPVTQPGEAVPGMSGGG